MWWLISIFVLLLVVGLYLIGKYNHLIRLSTDCDEAIETMDIFLKRRYDLIPAVAELIKGLSPSYKELAQKLLTLREEGLEASTIKEKGIADENMKKAAREFLALGEENPAVHSNAAYLELSGDIRALEQDISNAREGFNNCVKEYNLVCRMFPGNIVSSMFKFPLKKLIETEIAEQESNVSEF